MAMVACYPSLSSLRRALGKQAWLDTVRQRIWNPGLLLAAHELVGRASGASMAVYLWAYSPRLVCHVHWAVVHTACHLGRTGVLDCRRFIQKLTRKPHRCLR